MEDSIATKKNKNAKKRARLKAKREQNRNNDTAHEVCAENYPFVML